MGVIVNNMYWVWESVLSKQFCDAMLDEVDWANYEQATIQDNLLDLSRRRTDVVWQHPRNPLGCIARCYIDAANHQAGWGYDISEQENTQLSKYKSADEGFYDWHMDAFPPKNGMQRKLSCVILLNDSSEFEGGALELKDTEKQELLTKRGSIIVFPSFLEHRVTPVTKGVRYTAVTWANGPSFK